MRRKIEPNDDPIFIVTAEGGCIFGQVDTFVTTPERTKTLLKYLTEYVKKLELETEYRAGQTG